MTIQRTISPVDGQVYVERTLAAPVQIEAALESARLAQRAWRAVPIGRARGDPRPLLRCVRVASRRHRRGTVLADGPADPLLAERGARHARAGAPHDRHRARSAGRHRRRPEVRASIAFLRREPLGVVFTVAAWNYPYLIAVNSVVPALMAGNAVVLKHSAQTPLCAERFEECLREAGLPEGVFQALHLSHADTERVIRDPRVDFVAFTGSVAGGHAVQRAAADRFIGTGLELGGCDPAYVRARRRPRPRHRESRRRRVLQFRAIVLRHPARLRARAPVRRRSSTAGST